MVKRGKRKFRKYTIGKGKVWDGIKNFFKKTKILSTAANLIPGVGGALGNVISNVGYGRRRKHRTRKGGMANPFAKKRLGGLPNPNHTPLETNRFAKMHKGGPSSIPYFLKKGSGKRRIKKHHNGDNYENRYIDNKIRVL